MERIISSKVISKVIKGDEGVDGTRLKAIAILIVIATLVGLGIHALINLMEEVK